MGLDLYTVNHWVHLASAIAALGGAMFLRFVVHPSLQALKEADRAEFEHKLRRKSSAFVFHPLMVLIITGFINFIHAVNQGARGTYHMVFGIKFLLVMVLFGITMALIVPSEALAKFQANRPRWVLVNVILGLTIVFLSAWMRMIPR
jgi:uncharacterized membrane protein